MEKSISEPTTITRTSWTSLDSRHRSSWWSSLLSCQPIDCGCCKVTPRTVMFFACESLLMTTITVLAVLYVLVFVSFANQVTQPVVAKSLGTKYVYDDASSQSRVQGLLGKKNISSAQKEDWTDQLRYIHEKLTMYAKLDEMFQEKLGQNRVGKLLDAYIDVYENEGVFTLSIDFELLQTGVGVPTEETNKTETTEAPVLMAKSFNRLTRAAAVRTPNPLTINRLSSTAAPNGGLSESTQNLLKELQMDEKNTEAVLHAVQNGADVNGRHADGSPLMAVAIRQGFIEAVAILLEKGAHVNIKFGPLVVTLPQKHGFLHECVYLAGSVEHIKDIMRLLINNGANPESVNGRGETPQDLAIRLRQQDVAEFLATLHTQAILRRQDLN